MTVVVEVESTLNVRPLTYVYEEGDPEEAMPPVHMMYTRRMTVLSPYLSFREERRTEKEDSPKELSKPMNSSASSGRGNIYQN